MNTQNLGLNDLPGEIWKGVIGYEGLYTISNLGRIKSLSTINTIGRKLYIYIKKYTLHFDLQYPMVTLVKKWKVKGFYCS